VRGDRVEIVVDAGGEPRTYEVAATRVGRRVEVSIARGVVTVSEITRGGTVVRSARFLANRVLALVEHPASTAPLPDEEAPARPPDAAAAEQPAAGTEQPAAPPRVPSRAGRSAIPGQSAAW
jgi:hypothetical protein